ncbi:MFS transporter [Bacillus safensis]|uniref:MFS transporter n=1 Tax=Bacillus safensis TaxID=561879 RepID=UPI00115D5E16|nr:MFS transporter [Bacillus sp. SDF0016]TQR23971.1 MFS transporter [Bacillus sp. SDF0016]
MNKKPFRKFGLFEGYTLSIALSKLGNQIFYIVVPLYIYKETESALLMGIGWFFQSIPYLLTPWIGNIIDSYPKKNVFLIAELVQAISVMLIPLFSLLPLENLLVYYIYAISIVIQTASIISNVVGDFAFIPSLMRSKENAEWNSWYLGFSHIGRIAGPGIAGLLISLIGYFPTLILNAFTFLVTFMFVFFFIKNKEEITRRKISGFKEGILFIKNNVLLRKLIISFAFINLAIGGLTVVFIFLMKNTWLMNDQEIGIVMSLVSLGAVLGTIIGGQIFSKFELLKRLQIWGVFLVITLLPLIFLNVKFSIIGYILSQTCAAALTTLFMTYRQKIIPEEYVGRINAIIRMVLMGMIPISSLILTSLAELSFTKSIGILVVICILIGIVFLFSKSDRNKNKI